MSETLVKIRQVEGLRSELDFLGSIGGGGPSIQSHGSTSFNNTTPANDRFVVGSSAANNYNQDFGRCSLQFDFYSQDYFAQNPNGHFAIITRCDTDNIATEIRGQGVIIGNVSGAPNGSPVFPTVQIETFFSNLAAPGNRLLPDTYTYEPLVDNKTYRVIVSSTVRADGSRWIRYELYSLNVAESSYDLIRDTGDVLDNNLFIDTTLTGFCILHVFENGGASPWTVFVNNIQTIWEAAPASPATASPTLDLTGALGPDYTAANARLEIRSATVPFVDDTPLFIRDFRNNTGTQVLIMPNGTATDTGVVCVNKNTLTGAWTYGKIGITGNVTVVESFAGGGGVVAPISFMIQASEKLRINQNDIQVYTPLKFNSYTTYSDLSTQNTASGGIALRAYAASYPALANTAATDIIPNVVAVNIGSGTYNTGTGVYTIPQAGTYRVTATVGLQARTDTINLVANLYVRRNGASDQLNQAVVGHPIQTLTVDESMSLTVDSIFTCVAGDTIKSLVFISYSGAGTCAVSNNPGGFTTQLIVERL